MLIVIGAFALNFTVVEYQLNKVLPQPFISYLNNTPELSQYLMLVALLTLLLIAIFSWLTIRLMRNEIQKEKNIQEQLLVKHTKELTLIQTMSTMLNSVDGFDDAARVLRTIIPRLLPSLSGAVFLIKEDKTLKELAHWGEDWTSEIATISTQCWQDSHVNITNDANVEKLNVCSSAKCAINQHAMNVNLVDEKGMIGTLHFIRQEQVISEELRLVITNLAEQISFAFSNLRLKDELRNQAIRDPLTNLYNRRFMMEAFEPALHRAERHENHLAVLMIDLDHFKLFNDKFGHEVGDFVLRSIAEKLNDNLRLEDIACRYGGEEFIVICPDSNLRDTFVLAEKLIACINELNLSYKGQNLGKITLSIGASIFPNHALSTQQLIIQADKALYAAKSRGRNCAVMAQASTRYYQNI